MGVFWANPGGLPRRATAADRRSLATGKHSAGESARKAIGELCAVAVDVVLLTVRDGTLQVLLIDRRYGPYLGQSALPGGFVFEEDLASAARRTLIEETHIDGTRLNLEQLRSYGAPDRDPRGRVISVAYVGLAPNLPEPRPGSGAVDARWEPAATVLEGTSRRLAFDHETIVSDGVERIRSKLEYTTVAAAFCPPEFTVSELRRVYEIVWSRSIDPDNFQRKLMLADFLQPTGTRTTRDGGRSAELFRLNAKWAHRGVHPAMLRQRVCRPEPPEPATQGAWT
jgi:8-oxo-dGTP diphosphatase